MSKTKPVCKRRERDESGDHSLIVKKMEKLSSSSLFSLSLFSFLFFSFSAMDFLFQCFYIVFFFGRITEYGGEGDHEFDLNWNKGEAGGEGTTGELFSLSKKNLAGSFSLSLSLSLFHSKQIPPPQ